MKLLSKILRENWIIILVLLIPFAIIAWYWPQFPDSIPIHWNIDGNIDRYASRGTGLLFLPLINIGVFLLLLLVVRIDPKRENYTLFIKRYNGMRLSIHLFLFATFLLIVLTSLGYHFDFAKVIQTGILLLLLILGNYMGAVRPNYFVGVRTPWTLANEQVWVKTHRFTSRVWVVLCLVLLIAVWALNAKAPVILGGIVAMILAPIIYSFIIFRQLKHSNQE